MCPDVSLLNADMVALKSNRCIEEGCATRPTYGYEEGVPLYCKGHMLPGERFTWCRTVSCLCVLN